MTRFQKQVGMPAIASVILAVGLMAIDDAFGPRPVVLPLRYGAIVVHIPWLVALVLVGAAGTLLAKRSGASLGECVLVALSPALMIGGAVNLLMAVVVISASLGGHRVHPVDFIGHFVVGWLVFPAAALFSGSFLFLKGTNIRRQTA